MNTTFFSFTLVFFTVVGASAQTCKYDISISSGFYKAPNYKQVSNKTFLAADFDYHLSDHWTVSTGFTGGQFSYFEDWRNNSFDYNVYNNAKGYESHSYLTVSYLFKYKQKINLQIGTGVSLFTQRLKYPFQAPSSYGGPSMPGGTIFTAETSFSVAEIPIKIEGFYMLGSHIGIGIKAGIYLQENRFLVGTHVGPQLRIRL